MGSNQRVVVKQAVADKTVFSCQPNYTLGVWCPRATVLCHHESGEIREMQVHSPHTNSQISVHFRAAFCLGQTELKKIIKCNPWFAVSQKVHYR